MTMCCACGGGTSVAPLPSPPMPPPVDHPCDTAYYLATADEAAEWCATNCDGRTVKVITGDEDVDYSTETGGVCAIADTTALSPPYSYNIETDVTLTEHDDCFVVVTGAADSTSTTGGFSDGYNTNKLLGLGGDDVLCGSATGDHRFYGGDGDDLLAGGPGNDIFFYGGDGADKMFGGPGDDTGYSYYNYLLLYGDEGEDSIYADFGDDALDDDWMDDYDYDSNDYDYDNILDTPPTAPPAPPSPPSPLCGHCDSPLYCVDFDRSAANAGTSATSTHETILGIIEDHGGSKCFDMDKIFTSRNVMDNVERDMAASQFAQGVDTTLITGRYHNKVCQSIPNNVYWTVEISYNDDGSVNSFVNPPDYGYYYAPATVTNSTDGSVRTIYWNHASGLGDGATVYAAYWYTGNGCNQPGWVNFKLDLSGGNNNFIHPVGSDVFGMSWKA